MKSFPLVSICCPTYNQEQYIGQAIRSFLNQRTNFEFEIIIHDDASSDHTVSIIKEYANKFPNKIKPIYQQTNQMSIKNFNPLSEYCIPKAKGKYIAFCEGDDCWIDENKLQNQVDIMEQFPEVSLCTGGIKRIEGNKEEIIIHKIKENDHPLGFFYSIEDTKQYWLTQPLTWLFRKKEFNNEAFSNFKYCRDIHKIHYFLKQGKGFYITKPLGIYNIHQNGIHSGLSMQKRFEKDIIHRKEIFLEWNDGVARFKYVEAIMNLFHYEKGGRFPNNILKTIPLIIRAIIQIRNLETLIFIFQRMVTSSFFKPKS